MKLVVLLAGGTKKRQQKDIDQAKTLWTEYKARNTRHENGKENEHAAHQKFQSDD